MNLHRVRTMKKPHLLTCCFIALGLAIVGAWRAWNCFNPTPEHVFVKTFDCPEGKWAEVVPSDDTPVVQWWWYEQDRHLFYHADGKLTYADTPTLREFLHATDPDPEAGR
jgi:hypothetical protein